MMPSLNRVLGMERWGLIGGVIAIFLVLAVMGWHYQRDSNDAGICANPEAHCGEHHL